MVQRARRAAPRRPPYSIRPFFALFPARYLRSFAGQLTFLSFSLSLLLYHGHPAEPLLLLHHRRLLPFSASAPESLKELKINGAHRLPFLSPTDNTSYRFYPYHCCFWRAETFVPVHATCPNSGHHRSIRAQGFVCAILIFHDSRNLKYKFI